jgi:hypothetical protein
MSNHADTTPESEEYDYESYLADEDFQDFVREAARQFIEEASIEEIAEVVFGDMDEAIEAFYEERGEEGE